MFLSQFNLLVCFIFSFLFAIDEDTIQFSGFNCVCMMVKCSQVMGKRENELKCERLSRYL